MSMVMLLAKAIKERPDWRRISKSTKLAILIMEYHRVKKILSYKDYLRCLRLSGWQEEAAQKKAEWFVRVNSRGNGRILRGSHTREEWQARKEQYGNRCFYCGKRKENLTKDHIIPIASSGRNTIDNIIPACRACNSKKHTKPIEIFKNGAALKLI